MIYNFNLGIGWASSGVEYAQSYRAGALRNIGQKAKFIFTDMFPKDNIEHMTKNIGFEDDEVIWLYTFFTDTRVAPVSFTLADLEKSIDGEYTVERSGNIVRYIFAGSGNFYTAYLVNEKEDKVHRVEIVSKGCLIRKDYYTYCKIYSEFYAPLKEVAHLYARRYYNEDGTVAYEELIDDEAVMYRFPDKIICSKEELVGYMTKCLKLTSDDVVIIDRTTGIGQAIFMNAKPAKIGIIIHADHFSEGSTTEDYILWNNYYEYAFAQFEHVDFYIAATDAQSDLVREQFEKYMGVTPNVVTIPVGSISELKYPTLGNKRKPYSLITASRLASEKHIDWVVDAVAKAKKLVPDLSLDIYGKGPEEENLRKKIEEYGLQDSVHLMGQQNLAEVYQNYEAYIAGSTSEGFGLTLLEAIGAGLPIIGFDVRYGNPTFIDHEKNGYLIPVYDGMENQERVDKLSDCLIRMFTEADLEAFHMHSYYIATKFLRREVEAKWQNLLQ